MLHVQYVYMLKELPNPTELKTLEDPLKLIHFEDKTGYLLHTTP